MFGLAYLCVNSYRAFDGYYKSNLSFLGCLIFFLAALAHQCLTRLVVFFFLHLHFTFQRVFVRLKLFHWE